MKIFLIGLPGSGKTTIGLQLAQELKFRYLDLDKVLEAKNGRFIEEIWTKDGEAFFRQLEKEVLQDDIPEDGDYVIACGGGVVLDSDNKKYLNGLIIFLDTDVKVLSERLKTEESKRPLMKNVSIEMLDQERFMKYKDFADIIVSNNYNPETSIKVILNYIKAMQ
ncbi:MAG: AAA family ATPase [Acholeplasmatales bacterium]|jgi:shikimate kinase|nr:AAA family ATPase [Acholeplasmatales bacterium]